MNRATTTATIAFLILVLGVALGAHAQRSVESSFADNVVVPQTRVLPMDPRGAVVIERVEADVKIVDQIATTTMIVHLKNPTNRRLESELLVPVPDETVVKGFSFEGPGGEMTAKILPRDEARRIYESIVSKLRDPALLEFAGYNMVRSSVFPVEPHGSQHIRLVYENLLPVDGDRIDYVLPRSESLDYTVPWSIDVRVKTTAPLSTVYSPSHDITTSRVNPRVVKVAITDEAAKDAGAFRLSYLAERDGLTASLMAYPDEDTDDGYFLLLAGTPAGIRESSDQPAIRREITLVLDRSGSMNGKKLEQAREAAIQTLAALDDGERFNLIVYNSTVDRFSEEPVVKSDASVERARAYLKGVKARGGTNIHDALVEAYGQKPTDGNLPIVLFLTDGLPTVGQTSEAVIRDVATKRNPHNRRTFTFGVGVDVNTPLLEKIANETRAVATFVLPNEDIEVKVGRVFDRLQGPVLSSPELIVVGANGRPAPGRVRDVMPAKLPDLFEGDQLVVLGRYVGQKPLRFKLDGNYFGEKKTFNFTFKLDKPAKRNAFVPRLWASRQIAFLVDAVRAMGADGRPGQSGQPTDPRMKELVDEIVRLSTEFGILTEYTAFLAQEGTDLAQTREIQEEAADVLNRRAVSVRSGLGAVNQETNKAVMAKPKLSKSNKFLDARMNKVEVKSVQQMNDRVVYRKGGQWMEAKVAAKATKKADRTVVFASPEFFQIVQRLVKLNRQGVVALRGDILFELDGETILVKVP
ncbi:MAG: VWA domain-containing protein [bacterium]|nr:VWA domain-containing protein [bacterium]